MAYSLWTELHSYEYPGAHKTMAITAFIRYNPPNATLDHMFFAGLILRQSSMGFPGPRAVPRI